MISSTVGLEALLYDKPVLTLGTPFYSGYGVTLDVDSFAEIRRCGARAARASVRTRSESTASCTRRCGAATRARRCSSTVRTRTRCELAGSIEAAAQAAVADRRPAPQDTATARARS